MDFVKMILGQHWPWYSHQKLYDMVRTEATGAGAVEGADESWARFTAMMDESVEDIQQALAEAGASWEGLAAESMSSSVTPLSQWAQDAGTAGTFSGGSVRQVGESFSFTANAMPEPVRVTSTANSDALGIPAAFTHLFGGQTDQDRQEREAQEAKQRAVDLMRGYSRNVDSAVSSVGTFVPPQSVAVRVPPQTFGGPPGHTDGSIPGPTGETRGPRGAGEPRFPEGPGGPGDAPSPDPRSPIPTPGGVTPGPTDGGGQTTTPGSAVPVGPPPGFGQPPTAPLPGGPPVGGFDPVTGFPIDPRTGRPFDPVSGRPIDPTTGRPVGSGPGGRGASGDGHQPGGRAGLTGSGPLDSERAAAGRGGAAGPRAGAGGMGMGPMGAGAGARREEDEEHYSPDFLRDYHDEFWDGSPPVAPPVIGEEDTPPPSATQPSTGEGR